MRKRGRVAHLKKKVATQPVIFMQRAPEGVWQRRGGKGYSSARSELQIREDFQAGCTEKKEGG